MQAAVASALRGCLGAYLLGEREVPIPWILILAEGLTWQEYACSVPEHYLIQLGLGHRPSCRTPCSLTRPSQAPGRVLRGPFRPSNGLSDEQRNARREEIEALAEELNQIPTWTLTATCTFPRQGHRAILRAYLADRPLSRSSGTANFAPLPRPKVRNLRLLPAR